MGQPSVSVVIVNFRTPSLTIRAAESVLSEPEVAEVIVVENGSSDGSLDELSAGLADARVKLVQLALNEGYGQGANAGAEVATSPLLLLLNSDVVVHPGAVGHMRSLLLSREDVVVVGPLVLTASGEPQHDSSGCFPSGRSLLLRRSHQPSNVECPDWISGVAMAVRHRDFSAAGGFDADFYMYFEDVDLCRRLYRGPCSIRRASRAVVTHLGGASRQSSSAQTRQYCAARTTYLRKRGASVLLVMASRVAGAIQTCLRAVAPAIARVWRRKGA